MFCIYNISKVVLVLIPYSSDFSLKIKKKILSHNKCIRYNLNNTSTLKTAFRRTYFTVLDCSQYHGAYIKPFSSEYLNIGSQSPFREWYTTNKDMHQLRNWLFREVSQTSTKQVYWLTTSSVPSWTSPSIGCILAKRGPLYSIYVDPCIDQQGVIFPQYADLQSHASISTLSHSTISGLLWSGRRTYCSYAFCGSQPASSSFMIYHIFQLTGIGSDYS